MFPREVPQNQYTPSRGLFKIILTNAKGSKMQTDFLGGKLPEGCELCKD
jgi:hypothetical protein